MADFVVRWETVVEDVGSVREAAVEAWDTMRDPRTDATVLQVIEVLPDGRRGPDLEVDVAELGVPIR